MTPVVDMSRRWAAAALGCCCLTRWRTLSSFSGRARDAQQASGLVDHHDVLVLEQDIEPRVPEAGYYKHSVSHLGQSGASPISYG